MSFSSPESDDSDNGIPASWLPEREEVLLLNRQRLVQGNWTEVRDFLRQLPRPLASSAFTVCLLSDRGIRRYNKQFRHQDKATDVLSFPAQQPGQTSQDYLGDILISAETARENARRYGLRVEEELKVLILHGLLHLLGYDHENDGGRMARIERQYSRKLGLPQNLTERAGKPLPETRRSFRNHR
ncbi:MAG: rRNA maturation RNase YbeY [Acidobacteria bacterium]|nr:rRNA maturation RNase YbeY [Acidobacteriota bacterium]